MVFYAKILQDMKVIGPLNLIDAICTCIEWFFENLFSREC